MNKTNKIPTYDILRGHDFTNNLKALLGCKNFHELSKATGIPTSTFSTWNNKNRTSSELIIRLHMALNIPVRDLALGYQIKETSQLKVKENTAGYEAISESVVNMADKSTYIIETCRLKNGELTEKTATLFDGDLFEVTDHQALLAIKDTESTVIVDRNINQAVSGTYLIDTDGLLSLNEVQRLPGKKLAIAFSGSTLKVNEEEVPVIGKVILRLTSA